MTKQFDKEHSRENGGFSAELDQRNETSVSLYNTSEDTAGNKIMVVEVQYKQPKESYSGHDLSGNPFETFNLEEAEELVGKEGEINTKNSMEIMRVLFSNELLLEYAPLHPDLPDLPDFTYIPCVWGKRVGDGVPDGWIAVMKDVQREYNYRHTKIANNLNSFRAIIQGSP